MHYVIGFIVLSFIVLGLRVLRAIKDSKKQN